MYSAHVVMADMKYTRDDMTAKAAVITKKLRLTAFAGGLSLLFSETCANPRKRAPVMTVGMRYLKFMLHTMG